MTRHDDNLARLATARAKLADPRRARRWRVNGGDIGSGSLLIARARPDDAEHIAAIHNAWGKVLDGCGETLVAHAPRDGGGHCYGNHLAGAWPCAEYLNAEAVLKAVTP